MAIKHAKTSTIEDGANEDLVRPSDWNADHEVSGYPDSTTEAITLYVDAGSGNDENPGTSGSPKATILGALNALPMTIAHPATIAVRPGTYAELDTALEFGRFNTLDYITIKVVNDSDEDMFDNGKVTGGGVDYLDDSGKSWTVNQFTDGGSAYVWIYLGTGAGQVRQIASNTGSRIVTTVNWTVNPDNTSYYAIGGGALMSGTDISHTENDGKKVNVYGFRHTGATLADMRNINFGLGNFMYNYCLTSIRGIMLAALASSGGIIFNYIAATTEGIHEQGISYATIWSNVITDAAKGIRLRYGSIANMSDTVANINHIMKCTTGIVIEAGSGCSKASGQSFGVDGDANGDDILPDPSTDVPSWWT